MAWGEEDLISPKTQFPEAGGLRPQGPLCWPPGWEQGFQHPAPQSWTFRTPGSWGPRGLEGRRVKGNRAALPGVPTLRACLLKMLEVHQSSHDSFSAPSFLKCMCCCPPGPGPGQQQGGQSPEEGRQQCPEGVVGVQGGRGRGDSCFLSMYVSHPSDQGTRVHNNMNNALS